MLKKFAWRFPNIQNAELLVLIQLEYVPYIALLHDQVLLLVAAGKHRKTKGFIERLRDIQVFDREEKGEYAEVHGGWIW